MKITNRDMNSRRLTGRFADLIHDRGWRDPGYAALDLASAVLAVHPRPISQRALRAATAAMRIRNGLTQAQVDEAFAPLLEQVCQARIAA